MKYKKKPIVIEAFQWTNQSSSEWPQWFKDACTKENAILDLHCGLRINTLEGYMHVSHNDYIIKGVKGELYPCKPDIFEMSYEVVREG